MQPRRAPLIPLEAPRARALARRAACLLAGLACGCRPEAPEPTFSGPRHVVLVSLDTLRADATTLYRPELGTTPFLAKLAAERGVVFENHMVNSNNTLTSHATMFTGLLMLVHAAEDGKERSALAPEHVTVAERFQQADFDTAAFAAHELWISRDFGLDQGFDRFESRWCEAGETNQRFLDWLRSTKPRRMFAFLHYYDAHSESDGALPYSAPPEYLARFAPPAPEAFDASVVDPRTQQTRRASSYLDYHHPSFRPFPEGYVEYMRGCYDAGVAKLDRDLEQLFAELERMGILDEALVVITSDHGEEFKEHGGTLHNSYYDEIMHVPLLIVPPKGTPRPRPRVADLSRCVDIAATLLDYVELPPLQPTQGRSLRPALEGAELAYAETFFGRAVLRGQDEESEYKLALYEPQTFYDLDRDPLERDNLAGSAEQRSERYLRAEAALKLARRECDLLRISIGASRADGPPLNPRQLQDLQKLGYLGEAALAPEPPLETPD